MQKETNDKMYQFCCPLRLFILKNILREPLYRLKKSTKYRKNFILSFVLTYAVTVGIAIIATLLEMDANNTATMLFHRCQLSTNMYVWAKVIETVMPTTITFSGVTLLFQMSPRSIGTSGTFILTSISLLAALHIAVSQVSNSDLMFGLLLVALVLDVLPVAISCAFYIEPNGSFERHKQEVSDGSISGSIN